MYYIRKVTKKDKLNLLEKKFIKFKIINKEILINSKENKKIEYKKKIYLKLIKKIKNLNIEDIVLSKELKKDKELVNRIYSADIDIIEGKALYEYMLLESISYIIEKRKLKKDDVHISILINNLSILSKLNIERIVKEYKKVNIVTKYIKKIEKFQEKIFEEDGIMLNIGNNKKKGLAKSDIIINYDFPEEHINLYNIFEETIIINICENIKINNKRFNGLNIKDYEIKFISNDSIEEYIKNEKIDIYKYSLKDIFEANIKEKIDIKNNINNKNNCYKILDYIKEFDIKIDKLICNNSNL